MAAIAAEIGGTYVPLEDCDWVLWGPCGCPFGVTVGALPPPFTVTHATEESAWRAFYDTARDIGQAKRRGERVELLTHERYKAEIADRLLAKCPHGEQSETGTHNG